MAKLLLVDDDRSLRETLQDLLIEAGYEVDVAAHGGEALAGIAQSLPDLVLCDWRMPEVNGRAVLERLRQDSLLQRLPVIILTAFGDGESAMEAMGAGAYDFLVKPIDLDLVLSTVARALEHGALQREMERLERERFRDQRLQLGSAALEEPRLVGSSPRWIEVFKRIGQVARTDVSVLLLGETGTGKEVVARAIHNNSDRRGAPMIIVNCAAIPAELVEAELFGHERGAFTGAVGQRIGRFEAAHGGTLFLDEIGELPLTLQPKLLRVLQERSFERVGGTRTISADVRILAATNRDLAREVEEKRFRSDLFYRLNAFSLHLPPLRERRSDIVPLAEYFLARYARRNHAQACVLATGVPAMLEAYGFPGNVRELEQLMDRLAVSSAGRPITVPQLRAELDRSPPPERRSALSGLEDLPFHESVARWERHLIERALERSGGNKSEAAKLLRIQRRLLYEKLQQLGMQS